MFLIYSLKRNFMNLYLPVPFEATVAMKSPVAVCVWGSVGSSFHSSTGGGISKATSDPQQSLCKSVPIRDKLSWSVSACSVEEQAPAFSSPNFCPLWCWREGQGYKLPLLWSAQMVLSLFSSLTFARPDAEKLHNFKLVLLHCKKLEVYVLVTQSHLTLCDPTNCKPTRLLCPWNSPNKNTGVGCRSLLQEIFLTQDQTLVFWLQVDCLLLEEARRPPMKCHI